MKTTDTIKVHRYNNAVRRKLKNNHVTVCSEDDGTYCLELVSYDKRFASNPCVEHDVLRNVLRVSLFKMNKETLEAFILNAVELLNMQLVVDGREHPLTNHISAVRNK